ncbi:hypothetical protein HFP89_11540 [Wenzhouxiangella sp. XN79A]|uniref:uroporphyrinogen-III C-methyltransferase n=1 Tax=Wenzhouxiangella sp. XN79A TaxID=2724193 RepID=UPI00144A5F36|nr:uroporphyrinogen-III C-methyltransferase [Wenzhouxiangella sp. XN79A]NKI35795.1 hypothetical protein [Wenzhouxiangella sp. XN79A]
MSEHSDDSRTPAGREADPSASAARPPASDDDASPESSRSTSGAASGRASTTPATPDSTQRTGGGRGLAWLALLIALGALALAGFPFWAPADDAPTNENRIGADEFDALDGRLEALAGRVDTLDEQRGQLRAGLESDITALEQALAEVREAAERDPDALDALARRIGRLEGSQSSGEASLEARMGSLEQRIEQRVEALQDQLGSLGADLEAIGQARARRLAAVHARALLVQGRDAWMLNADAGAARAAWQRAAARLADIGPDAAAGEAMDRLLRSAERLQGPDTADRVAALQRLAASAADWPSASRTVTDETTSSPGPGDPSSATWRDRVAGAFGALVKVETIDDAPPTPVELDRARSRITSILEAAAIATARQDWATAAALVDDARQTVTGYFDRDTTIVGDALERLNELGAEPEPPALPAAYDDVLDGLDAALEREE